MKLDTEHLYVRRPLMLQSKHPLHMLLRNSVFNVESKGITFVCTNKNSVVHCVSKRNTKYIYIHTNWHFPCYITIVFVVHFEICEMRPIARY
jgi:hypothetical protein